MNDTATDIAAEDVGAQSQEQTPAPQKAKVDHIQEIAQKVENLTKQKALNRAMQLVNDIDENYVELGGVLKVIREQSWFEGSETFEKFVFEKYGFKARKAKYLMNIYEKLVVNQIPWDKVSSIGWTKLRDLADVLTLDNVDEWVAKAKTMTVAELQMLLKGTVTEDGNTSATTKDDIQTLKFKLKADQVETVQSALNKAKAETNTEFDNVAIEQICSGYLGGSINVGAQPTLSDLMVAAGWEGVLEQFSKLFPDVSLSVEISE